MKVYYSDHLLPALPGSYFFPASRYGLLYQRIRQAHLPPLELCSTTQASEDQILAVHTREYFEKILIGTMTDREIRRIGIPWSPELYSMTSYAAGGTIAACRSAIQDGISCNLAGGAHHAYPDHGEGYCVFNNIAIAARTMQDERWVDRIVVLDCDVHQGNGTARIFTEDPNVFTFSVHGIKNFPYHKEIGSLDIALPDGSGDEAFLEAVWEGVPVAIDHAQPQLAIYVAGADPYVGDRLGRLAMTKEGLAERDKWIIEYCLAIKLPVAIVMGGGYARQIEDVIDIHAQTVTIAAELAAQH